MTTIALHDYSLPPFGKGLGLHSVSFGLSRGEVCAVHADQPDDAHIFMRALATLEKPSGGEYYFQGERLDFSNYINLLPYKRKIGYISPDSVLISNRTLRENLVMSRIYFENRADMDLDGKTAELCRFFKIEDKLDMRPAHLDREDVRLAFIIRELTKGPEVIILERPRDHLGYIRFGMFLEVLRSFVEAKVPFIVLTSDEKFLRDFSNREVAIRGGTVDFSALPVSGRD